MSTIKFFSAEDVNHALAMNKAIDAMAEAFVQLSSDEAMVPLRTPLKMSRFNAGALFMPGYLPGANLVGVKTVTVHKDNPSKGLPRIYAMVQIFDAGTGRPLAVIDGESLTAIRTGAVSGLATKYLARENSEILAIIGTGAQADAQLEAVRYVRNITKAFVFDIDLKRAENFAERNSKKFGIEIKSSTDKSDISLADIICTATSSLNPVFDDMDLKNGVHINGIGSYRPDMCEIPSGTILRSKLVVDQKNACLAEAGDIIQPIEKGIFTEGQIHAEMGEIILGQKQGRESEDEVTVFKSVGLAVQDLAAAKVILDKDQESDLGTSIKM